MEGGSSNNTLIPPDSADSKGPVTPGASDAGITSPGIGGAGVNASNGEDLAGGLEGKDYLAGLGATFKYPGDPRKLREKSKMKLWRDYLVSHGRNLTLIRYPQFLRLVQVGLPNRLRGEIWELCTGSIYHRFSNPGEYERILRENQGRKSTSTEEIEKDLNRSLPEYPGYQSPEGIEVRQISPANSDEPFRLTSDRALDSTKGVDGLQLEKSRAWVLSGNEHCRRSIPDVRLRESAIRTQN